MLRTFLVLMALATATTAARTVPPAAQASSPLAGTWALNRSATQVKSDVGFTPTWMRGLSGNTPGGGTTGGGRGGRGSRGGGNSGGAAPVPARPGEFEEPPQVRFLTDEVRNPPMRLTIAETDGSVTFTNEIGQARTLHLTGTIDKMEIQDLSFSLTAGRVGDQVIVNYHLAQNREVRYAYAATSSPRQLIVDVQFLERGVGDHARLVYDPAPAIETAPPALTNGAAPNPSAAGAAPTTAAAAVDSRPGAELKGLKRLGIVVEDLSSQSTACGLNQTAIEKAVTSRLTAGGLTVRRNSDDDTYVYVNIITNPLPGGMCVSRYDAFLYSYAASKLSYRDQQVLAQVQLAHKGGISSGTPAANGADVVRALEGYADLFVTQIRDANK